MRLLFDHQSADWMIQDEIKHTSAVFCSLNTSKENNRDKSWKNSFRVSTIANLYWFFNHRIMIVVLLQIVSLYCIVIFEWYWVIFFFIRLFFYLSLFLKMISDLQRLISFAETNNISVTCLLFHSDLWVFAQMIFAFLKSYEWFSRNSYAIEVWFMFSMSSRRYLSSSCWNIWSDNNCELRLLYCNHFWIITRKFSDIIWAFLMMVFDEMSIRFLKLRNHSFENLNLKYSSRLLTNRITRWEYNSS